MTDSKASTASPARPRIWCLYGARTGDNQQVSALAGALGWPTEELRLDYSCARSIPNMFLGATLLSVRKPAQAQLTPPWPDLVIASGQRSVAPARWIRKQSGNKTKLVQIGRPRAPLDLFDLVITTAQYGLPAAENVLSLSLPLQQVHKDTEEQAAAAPFGDLPRPWTGVFVGGTTWPYVLDTGAAAFLADDLNRWIGNFGGSLIVSTSPRTAPEAAQSLADGLEVPHYFHRWEPGTDNPYNAILRSADRLVVTGDSVSMLSDACRTGKPTAIWKPCCRRDPVSRFCLVLANHALRTTPLGVLLRFTALKGLFTPPRHVERLTTGLVMAGKAYWFDTAGEIRDPQPTTQNDDMDLAVTRVRALFEGGDTVSVP